MEKTESIEPTGPTGKFPDGKLHSADMGEIVLEIGCIESKGLVRINTGIPIQMLAMSPSEAIRMAETLIKKAKHLQDMQIKQIEQAMKKMIPLCVDKTEKS